MIKDCILCEEPVEHGEPWMPINGVQQAHRECLLRDVMGGIGHLIAHEYWCLQHHDPDARLTYRQSAKLTWEYVHVVGAETAAQR